MRQAVNVLLLFLEMWKAHFVRVALFAEKNILLEISSKYV
jgi:hypothetical protein